MINSELKLGEILVQKGLLKKEVLEKVLKVNKTDGKPIGELLIKAGIVSEKDVAHALSEQLDMPYASLENGLLNPQQGKGLEKIISEEFARHHLVTPLSKTGNILGVAMVDPTDVITLENIRLISDCEVKRFICIKSELLNVLDFFYSKKNLFDEEKNPTSLEEGAIEIEEDSEEITNIDEAIAEAKEARIIRIVDITIKEALKERASDIHFESDENGLKIRYRIDGLLYDRESLPKNTALAAISRVKILARLNIGEKRLPQDGSFSIRIGTKPIDVRVSTLPTTHGEKVVMRLLNKEQACLGIGELGLNTEQENMFKKTLSAPYGLIFISGPTGSGKTTTLYGMLTKIKSSTKNIITIEDPVEYQLDGVSQVQVKPVIGLTFAHGLRAFLRQDPDIIMVGEIRDQETAQICVRASLTGHLVLSTLHTNDAPTAIVRIIDIGIEPFLLAPSLVMVASQRLIRLLCPECKKTYTPDKEILKELKLEDVKTLYQSQGCKHCNMTGYFGRTGIFEVISIDDEIKESIQKRISTSALRNLFRKKGMKSMRQSGLDKVEKGLTTIEEVLSATFDAS